MPTFAGKPSSFFATTGGKPVEGAWYSGRRYLGGQLLAPGEHQPGKQVSKEVTAQTDPGNVSFIESERMKADQIQSPTNISLPKNISSTDDFVTGVSAEVDKARKAQEDLLAKRQETVDIKIEGLREKEKETLGKIETVTTPFREELETAERDRLFINENFEANQILTDELDQLLTEGNELIRRQEEVTGLAAVRNPRIQKTMDDVTARTGVIQAVINARNGQISVAENMIDRSINAIAADRNDQISYYETILNLDRQDIFNLDSETKKIAEEQLNLKKFDLENANRTATMLKDMMIDPAKAQLIGQAGVKLTDTVEQVNQKLARATYAIEVADLSNEMVLSGAQAVINPKDVPKDELRVLTDSKGNKHYYRVKEKTDGRVGTAGERAVARVVDSISNQGTSFPDVIVSYANQLTLSEIYSAYNQSEMGQKWGRPAESSNEIALLYKWARGEITENEYRVALGE